MIDKNEKTVTSTKRTAKEYSILRKQMHESKYETIKEKYLNGEIAFSIDLAKARKITSTIKKSPIAMLTNTIYLLCICCCIYSFLELKWFGLLYTVIYTGVLFSLFGICSLPQSKGYGAKIIIIGTISIICSAIYCQVSFTFLVFFSFFDLFLVYYLYQLSAKVFIAKFIFADIKSFDSFYQDVFYIKEII